MVKERRSKNIGRKQRKKKNTLKRRVSRNTLRKRNTLRRKNFRGGAPGYDVKDKRTGDIMKSISDNTHKHYHIYNLGKLEESAVAGGEGFVQNYSDTFIVTKIITNSSIFKYLEREDSVIIELAVVNHNWEPVNIERRFDPMESHRINKWFLVFLPYTIKVSDFSHVLWQSCFTEKCKEDRINNLQPPFILNRKASMDNFDKINAIVSSIIQNEGGTAPNLPQEYATLFPRDPVKTPE
jgi:hypothetical protein